MPPNFSTSCSCGVEQERAQIEEVFIKHFTDILPPANYSNGGISALSHLRVTGKLTSEDTDHLSRPVEKLDVEEAIKHASFTIYHLHPLYKEQSFYSPPSLRFIFSG